MFNKVIVLVEFLPTSKSLNQLIHLLTAFYTKMARAAWIANQNKYIHIYRHIASRQAKTKNPLHLDILTKLKNKNFRFA